MMPGNRRLIWQNCHDVARLTWFKGAESPRTAKIDPRPGALLVRQDSDVDEIARRALAAIVAKDWAAVTVLLHPYLHWTGSDGRTVRGRRKVMAALAQASQAPPPPTSVELRNGQIYRWRS
jgi:Domain of unknown function (DUF4440)